MRATNDCTCAVPAAFAKGHQQRDCGPAHSLSPRHARVPALGCARHESDGQLEFLCLSGQTMMNGFITTQYGVGHAQLHGFPRFQRLTVVPRCIGSSLPQPGVLATHCFFVVFGVANRILTVSKPVNNVLCSMTDPVESLGGNTRTTHSFHFTELQGPISMKTIDRIASLSLAAALILPTTQACRRRALRRRQCSRWRLRRGRVPHRWQANQGSSNYSATYQGATWHFATMKNQERFMADPAKYALAYGGWCAAGASKKVPTAGTLGHC